MNFSPAPIRKLKGTFPCLLAVFALWQTTLDSSQAQSSEPYKWQQVAIGGGGFFTGVEFAPSQKDRLYLRSDVAGPWRRDSLEAPWTSCNFERAQFTPFISAPCAGLAVHPTKPDIAYGNFTMDYSKADDLYKTTDAGQHWTLVKEVKASEKSLNRGRQFGPAVAVDSHNPNVVYFRTKTDGLYRTTNGDEGEPVFSNVLPQQTGEIDFFSRSVVVDPAVKLQERSRYVYVSAAGLGIFRSDDGGDSFALMKGSPVNVRWMRLGGNGRLYVTGTGGVFRCDNPRTAPELWTDITPQTDLNVLPKGAMGMYPSFPETQKSRGTWGLGCDPGKTDRLVVTGMSATVTPVPDKPDRITPKWELWRSNDAGKTWTCTTQQLGDSVTGWVKKNLGAKLMLTSGGLAIDPFTPDRAYLFGVFEIYRTENIWGGADSSSDVTWELDNRNAEDVIPLNLCTPPAEPTGATAPLYSGVSDVRGFRHIDLNVPPAEWVQGSAINDLNDWAHSYVTGYDYAENNPLILMACKDWRFSISNVLRSTDGGITWNLKPRPVPDKGSIGGDIALSLDGSNAVFGPANGQVVRYSRDGGETWEQAKIAGTETPFIVNGSIDAYDWDATVRADRVKDGVFYGYSTWKNPGFFVSTDGGATWTMKGKTSETTSLKGRGGMGAPSAPVTMAVCPGKEGEIWMGLNFAGIYKSSDFGETFTKVEEFDSKDANRAQMVAFGKAAPGNTHGTVYVYGKGSQGWGTYRSTDLGASWTKLGGFEGLDVRVLAADRQVYGRVYLGEGASGIFYGIPETP